MWRISIHASMSESVHSTRSTLFVWHRGGLHSHSTLAKRHCVTPKAFQGHSQIPRRPGTLLKLDELTSKPVTLMVSAFPLLDTRPKFPARPAPAQTPAGCQRKTNGRLQSAPLGASAAGPATAHVRPPRIKALGLTECAAHGTCTHDLTLCAGQARNVRCLCSHHRRDVDAWHRGWSHRCTPCTASGASARSLWGAFVVRLASSRGDPFRTPTRSPSRVQGMETRSLRTLPWHPGALVSSSAWSAMDVRAAFLPQHPSGACRARPT